MFLTETPQERVQQHNKNVESVSTPHLDPCKVSVTISLFQLLRYRGWYSWSLARNYSQYIACLMLGVNTQFVLGLP